MTELGTLFEVVLAVALWLVVAFAVFGIAAWLDEDVNHWRWTEDGPGIRTNLRFVAYGVIVASSTVGLVAWLLLR